VTGAAETSIACIADRFTYKACVVPKPKGKSLKADRKELEKAGCKLGRIRGEKSKSAKVKQQSPKPGKALAPGSKVNVKLDS
jgi:beta-lactam-binding protein with PASTA domain